RLLWMHTFQTGHEESSRESLLQLHQRRRCRDVGHRNAWINLEPWYEGIRERFGLEDQLFAYWICLLSGAAGHCYGAHGVWNAGDGDFLAHWGRRSYSVAVRSATPAILGRTHATWRTLA